MLQENETTPPPKIKKYKSAYLHFSSAELKRIHQENSNTNFPYIEIIRKIAQKWAEMPNSEKQIYKDLEQKDKDKFNTLKQTIPYTYNKSSKIKKPKRARTAFMIYLHENKGLINKESSSTIVKSLKQIGLNWKNISTEEKEIYLKKEREDKERYQLEYSTYMSQLLQKKRKRKSS